MTLSDREPRVVLDSWAVIEYLDRKEPAHSMVGALLARRTGPRPIMNEMNASEAGPALMRRVGLLSHHKFRASWTEMVDLIAVDAGIWHASEIFKYTYWMSKADGVAAATAIRHDAELWTGDPELLCNERIWKARDLRGPAGLAASAHSKKRTGLRTSVRKELTRDAIDLSAMVKEALKSRHRVTELAEDPGLGL